MRDMIMGRPSHDKDYCVTGVKEEAFCAVFPKAARVGRSFPVYLLIIDGKTAEVAFARRERKIGAGYRGFAAHFSPEVAIEEDLFRRDSTMNAMAIRLDDGQLIDPYHGRTDIGLHRIRAVSEHFLEDPVRALRAARQAAELNFAVDPDTVELMGKCENELAKEPGERVAKELAKALAADRPSIFFRELQKAKLLQTCFPELYALIGKTQPPQYHPEEDAFEHSMLALDLVSYRAQDLATRFAALTHDLGKSVTPKEMLPHHYGHEVKGLEVLASWNRRMTLPRTWTKMACFVIKNHMRAPRIKQIGKMADLLMALDKQRISLKGFNAIVEADAGDLPSYLQNGENLIDAMKNCVSGSDAPRELSGEAISKWIRERRIEELRKRLRENQEGA